MTKRRPSWSDWRSRVAAFACGLLLLYLPSTVLAAGKVSVHRSSSAKKPSAKVQGKANAKPAGKAPAKVQVKSSRARSPMLPPASETGVAEMLESDTRGLHGHASFYGHGFQGRKTSTGERFDVQSFTAASNHFPLGTMVAVHRLDTDRCAIVKVNDRMHAKHRRRVIDVSRGVAEYLDMIRAGVVLVRVAPMWANWERHGLGACLAAFATQEEIKQAPRLPDFGAQDLP